MPMVAHHTCALVEARLRALDQVLLIEFPPPASSALSDALTCSDLTTSPTGARIRVTDRLAEIRSQVESEGLKVRPAGPAIAIVGAETAAPGLIPQDAVHRAGSLEDVFVMLTGEEAE